jgi:hypothetical protein
VQRVPAVVGGGTWTSFGVSVGGYGGHSSDGTEFSGTFVSPSFGGGSTDLAARLAPPRNPHRVYSGWFFAGLATLGYGVACALMAAQVFTSQPPDTVIGLGIASALLLALSGLCWWKFALHQAELGKEKREYSERMQRWNTLYYCGRCDSVYDPASGRAVSSHEVAKLFS